jgi:hypothetical protein
MRLPVLLFTQDADYAAQALQAGAAGVVVDWEWRGKQQRQAGADTEINQGTVEGLRAMRAACGGHLICRINNTPTQREAETRLALELGANEIWLPMVQSLAEVESCLALLTPGTRLGVLAETRAAQALAADLATLPLARVFFGLNDYRIDAGHAELFEPLIDGTVQRFRETWGGPFGVAGVTHPGAGQPVPQTLLLGEMARLRCDFGVARRSFRADVAPPRMAECFAAIDAAYAAKRARTAHETERDHRALRRLLRPAPPQPVPV